MATKSAKEVTEAIRQCLDQCHGKQRPLDELLRYLGVLRIQGWAEDDIQLVESAIRHILSVTRAMPGNGSSK